MEFKKKVLCAHKKENLQNAKAKGIENQLFFLDCIQKSELKCISSNETELEMHKTIKTKANVRLKPCRCILGQY